jgi:hypothetical protein
MVMKLPAALAVTALLALPGAASAANPTVQRTSAAPFSLTDTNGWNGNGAAVDALVRSGRAQRATVADVIASVNHDAHPLTGNPGIAPVSGVAAGFQWTPVDEKIPGWYPQGLTTSWDAVPGGTYAGHRIVLASWYSTATGNGDQGVRLTFVNVDNPARPTYRHVLLVQPSGTLDYQPVRNLHAGGIAWVGNLLYVADTHNGLRVFDMNNLLKVDPTGTAIGCASGTCSAATYKYVLPQVDLYKQPASQPATFSFVSLDRATSPMSLVTGEYRDRQAGGRLIRWKLAPGSNRLQSGRAWTAFTMGMANVQGALSTGRRFLLSTSHATAAGQLFSAPIAAPSRSYSWASSPEDLSFAPDTGLVWGLTERPGARVVFAVPTTALP